MFSNVTSIPLIKTLILSFVDYILYVSSTLEIVPWVSVIICALNIDAIWSQMQEEMQSTNEGI